MPVILPDSESIMTWLGARAATSKQVCSLLKPYDAGDLDVYPVPREVGKVGNDNESFILPVSSRKDGIAAAFGRVKKPEKDVNSESHAPMMEEVKAVEGGGVKRKHDDVETDEKLAKRLQKEEDEKIKRPRTDDKVNKETSDEASGEASGDQVIKKDEDLARNLQNEKEVKVGEEQTAVKEEESEPSSRKPSSKFSPEPYNPPVSPHRPRGGYSSSTSLPTKSPSRKTAPSKKLEEQPRAQKTFANSLVHSIL